MTTLQIILCVFLLNTSKNAVRLKSFRNVSLNALIALRFLSSASASSPIHLVDLQPYVQHMGYDWIGYRLDIQMTETNTKQI